MENLLKQRDLNQALYYGMAVVGVVFAAMGTKQTYDVATSTYTVYE